MLTNYYRNKLIDHIYRNQSWSEPATRYAALLSAASTSAHTEVTAGSVARVGIAAALANWAGTQGDGTTAASSGTTGVTSNNADIEFIDVATDAVSASYVGIFDAASSGNLLEFYPIVDSNGDPITRSWETGDRIAIDAAGLRITWA